MKLWTEDRAGDGVPALLLHGGWTDARIWDPLVALLPSRRLIRYDARGYGRSPKPVEQFTQFADALAVLDDADVEQAVLVGHSGGGATALSVAVEHPERVAGLVLVAPGVGDYPWPLDDPYFAEFGAAAAKDDRDALLELGLGAWAPGDDSELTATLFREAIDAMFSYAETCLPDPPAFERLGEIEAPTTILIGTRDHHTVRDCTSAVADRVPASRIVAVEGADHLLPLRAPDQIAALL